LFAGDLFADNFTQPNGLITNEYAYFNPSDPSAVQSPLWETTSGSLFESDGAGWSGTPDNVSPNPTSSNGTDSAVFRLTTKPSNFGDVAVSFMLLNQGLSSTSSTPPVDWDGIHVFLRYQSEYNLYYASINRRDDTVVIKKKVPGGPSNGGTYYDLSPSVSHVVPYNSWQLVRATVQNNADGSVTIKLYSGDTLLVSATDDGSIGGPPITAPGKVGIRGDNCDFKIDDFTVSDLSGSAASMLPVASVSASSDDGNVPANTLDGNLSARWSAEGDGQWVRYDLGSIVTVDQVQIAFYRGDQRTQAFDVQVSTDDSSWATVFSGQSSGTTTSLQSFDFSNVSARYVRIVGHGNSQNDWNSLTEVGIWGYPPSVASKLSVASVSASSDDGNVPANTLDGNLSTRWSAEGDGQWVRYDLGSIVTVDQVQIAFYLGDQRTQAFDVQVSTDDSSWATVFSGQSSGTTTSLQSFDFSNVSARYVRIVGHGNSQNDWNSLTEVGVWGWPWAVSQTNPGGATPNRVAVGSEKAARGISPPDHTVAHALLSRPGAVSRRYWPGRVVLSVRAKVGLPRPIDLRVGDIDRSRISER
jgi:hypothetical protein